MTAAPARILIVRLSHLGDVVLGLPVLHALRAAYPRAEIGWAVQPEFASLLEGMSGLSRLFLFDRRGGLRAWSKLREGLGRWSPELTVDVQGNVKSAMVALASGAPRRMGLASADWTERIAAGTLTECAAPAAGPHGMQRALAIARHVAPELSPRFDPALDKRELELGRVELDRRFETRAAGWILHLADDHDLRAWPSAGFAEVARRLAREGQPVLLLSGPREAATGERLRSQLPNPPSKGSPRHWVNQRGLRSLAAVFAAAAEGGHRLLACDSGPAHLAASVGLPVTLIAGPQDPARTGPWPLARPGRLAEGGTPASQPHRYVQKPDPPDCLPCLSRRCAHPRGPVCLSELGVEDVLNAMRGGVACA